MRVLLVGCLLGAFAACSAHAAVDATGRPFSGVHRLAAPTADPREGVSAPAPRAFAHSTTVATYPTYRWPLDGAPHDGLVIVNYVDHDPASGLLDYSGGAHTYDGHRGTDIALYDFRAMDRGAVVRAAAAGTVYRVSPLAPAAFDRHCLFDAVDDGNWVQIDNGNGAYSYALHLRANSMTVDVGDAVQEGQILGLVGSSGYSTFPHVHFEPGDYDGGPYEARDPFHGPSQPLPSLWRSQPEYAGDDSMWFTQIGVFTEEQVGGSVFNTDWCAILEHPIQPAQTGIHETRLPMWFQFQGNVGDVFRVELRRPDTSVWAAFEDTLRYDARLDWFWAYYFWDGGVSSADYGTWTLNAYANGVLSRSKPFVVGPATVYGPRVAPGVSRSFRVDGTVQRDTLRVRPFGGPVTWSLVGAPAGVSLADSILTIGAVSAQPTRSAFFHAVATDAGARRDTAWFHLVDRSKPLETVVGVDARPRGAGLALGLDSANPGRGDVVLRLAVPDARPTGLTLHDLSGRRVRTLVAGERWSGERRVLWDGRDGNGRRVPAGLYFARLEHAGARRDLKLVRLP
jgi:murein DD-endopeptidase MepM/ murein hydrolase activator NlpD